MWAETIIWVLSQEILFVISSNSPECLAELISRNIQLSEALN